MSPLVNIAPGGTVWSRWMSRSGGGCSDRFEHLRWALLVPIGDLLEGVAHLKRGLLIEMARDELHSRWQAVAAEAARDDERWTTRDADWNCVATVRPDNVLAVAIGVVDRDRGLREVGNFLRCCGNGRNNQD